MWKTTIRGIRAHKVRLVSTTLAIILGVAFMAGTLVFTDTVGKSFDDLFADANAGVDVAVRGERTIDATSFSSTRPNLPAMTLAEVEGVDGVDVAVGYVEGYAQLVGADGEAIGDPASGAPTFGQSWIDADDLNPWTLAEGSAPSGPDQVVIDRGSSKKGELAVGDRVTVLTGSAPRDFTVSGLVTWGEADSPLGASAAIFDLSTAQEVLRLDGKLTNVYATAEPGVGQDALAASVQAAVGDEVEVVTGAALTAEGQQDIAEALGFFNTFLLAFALVALFVGAFIIYNTFSIVVAQRTRELALLRALGASRGQVVRSVMIEATVVGAVASALGLLAGIGISFVLRGLMKAVGFDIPSTGTVILPASMITAFVTGFVITMVAALLPAWRGSRVPPIAALRDVAVDRSSTSAVRVVTGLVIGGLGVSAILLGLFGGGGGAAGLVGLGAAVTFIGVFVLGPVIARPVVSLLGAPIAWARGVTGRLAGENARRNPKRTASTAVALTIGVSLVAFISIFAASATSSIDATIDQNFSGDLVLTAGGFGPGAGFSPELAAAVADVDGVAAVAEVRFGQAEIDGEGAFYSAVDPAQATQVFDIGVQEGSIDTLATTGIAVFDDLAAEKGWQVGDTLTVTFSETGAVELPLVATYDRQDIAGPMAVGLGTHEANTGEQLDLQAAIKLTDGADPAAMRSAIESVADAYPNVKVQDLTQYKEAQAAQINQMLSLIYALLFLAVLIALIGIANTLTLSIHERTRELGLLRAVGLSRSQLRAAVRWESVIIALFGTALGLGVGLFFGWALVRAMSSQGFTTLDVPVAGLAVITVVAAVAGVLAGLWPAWKASRLDILGAIASE